MPLWNEVVTRHSDDQLVGLTNPDTPDPDGIDQDRADAAVADAIADMLTHAQVTYDDGDARHIALGVFGVIAYLQSRGGTAAGVAETSLEDYRAALDRYAESATRNRVQPDSSRTQDDRRPEFTPDRKFDGATPNPPRAVGSGREETWSP